jgi:hypothetical protein
MWGLSFFGVLMCAVVASTVAQTDTEVRSNHAISHMPLVEARHFRSRISSMTPPPPSPG